MSAVLCWYVSGAGYSKAGGVVVDGNIHLTQCAKNTRIQNYEIVAGLYSLSSCSNSPVYLNLVPRHPTTLRGS
jgi:hypothetical protein